MNLATRKALYSVVVCWDKNCDGTLKFQDFDTAREVYEKSKKIHVGKTVLFCWTKPTVTKGQIDPDLY
jgi:hypothetical protein